VIELLLAGVPNSFANASLSQIECPNSAHIREEPSVDRHKSCNIR
jgi:hypothetical protein